MQHRGKIVEAAIKESGILVRVLSQKLGITRQTLRTWLNAPNLEYEKILQIGKALKYDFTDALPELASQTQDPETMYRIKKVYGPDIDPRCLQLLESKDEVIAVKEEMIDRLQKLMNDHIKTYKELLEAKDEIIKLKTSGVEIQEGAQA